MSASTPEATVAAIERAEDAAQDTLNFVMANMRANRQLLLDPAVAIYSNSKARHARSILLGAACLSFGISNRDIVTILNSIRAVEHCHPDDHEAQEEQWERIVDIARDQARECREYAATCLADHGDAL